MILMPGQCWWRIEQESSDFGTQALLHLRTIRQVGITTDSQGHILIQLPYISLTKNGQFTCFLHGFIAAANRYRWQPLRGWISWHRYGNQINIRLNQLTTDLEEINQHLSEKIIFLSPQLIHCLIFSTL